MTQAGADVIDLAGVTVVRDGTPVLVDLDWQVRGGERWVVIGPNGAGKTTLLSLVAGAWLPTAGSATVLGERLDQTHIDMADLDELATRVGWASAALADQVPAATRVLDLVVSAAHGAIGLGPGAPADPDPYDEDRAFALLGQFGCGRFTQRAFGSLSEGERKRVLMARAMMTDPELLVLDEPAAGLDLGAREALLRRLTRFALDPAAPVTVLVSHHVEEIPAGFSHALVLRAGRVVAAGPLPRVLTGATLSTAFGLPLVVDARDGRYAARLALA